MRVRIPSVLHSYTGGRSDATAAGDSLAAVLGDLDRQYPGLRFRIVDEQDRLRPHVRVFVDGQLATGLAQPVGPDGEVMIVAALSGG